MNLDQIPMPARVPLVDDDTHELLDDALAALAKYRGLPIGDEHVMIHLLASLIAQAKDLLPAEVATARDNGSSAKEIASLLGTNTIEIELNYNDADW